MDQPAVDTKTIQNEVDQIARAAKDPEAFRPLYEAYFKRILLFVLHRVGDKQTASDITQQVFLNALSNIGKFQPRGVPFSSWLFRIAVNQCHDFFRKNKKMRMVVLEESAAHELFDDLTAEQQWDDWEKKLPSVLEKLKEDDLQIIELRYFEKRPFKEISEILGITESNTKVRTYRIIDKMKRLFLDEK